MILNYNTQRLNVANICADIDSSELSTLLIRVTEIFSPEVVKNLPPYFHNIYEITDAQQWWKKIHLDKIYYSE